MKNKKMYPLSFIQKVNEVKNLSKTIADDNIDLVRFKEISLERIHIVDQDENSDFYLIIKNPQPKDRTALYEVEQKPAGSETIDVKKFSSPADSLKTVIGNWINVIKAFNSQPWKDETSIIDGYEKEYFEPIRLDEDDADSESFDYHKQEIIRAYLQKSILLLESKGKEENKDLISDAQKLHDEVTRLTKNEILRRMSRFWGKARFKGMELVKDLFREAYSMGLQAAIKAGSGHALEWFN